MGGDAAWLALVWRLPTGSSTPRVTIWRSLKRLGAATLTPGAALLPYREELLEQLGWLAQEIDEMGGDAWILPVTELTEMEESRVHQQVSAEREGEYRSLERAAFEALQRRAARAPSSRDVTALRARLDRVRARDHFGASGQQQARDAIDRCVAAWSESDMARPRKELSRQCTL